jgi:hypothetical protein
MDDQDDGQEIEAPDASGFSTLAGNSGGWIAGDLTGGRGLLGMKAAAPPSASAGSASTFAPHPVPIVLPGMGADYIDESVRDRAYAFAHAMIAKGLAPNFVSTYRSPERQADIQKTTPNAADRSLHEMGMAADLDRPWWDSLKPSQRQQVIEAGKAAGWSWGGNFRHNAEVEQNHFYIDPGAPRGPAIKATSEAFRRANIDTRDHTYKSLTVGQ